MTWDEEGILCSIAWSAMGSTFWLLLIGAAAMCAHVLCLSLSSRWEVVCNMQLSIVEVDAHSMLCSCTAIQMGLLLLP